MTAEVNKHDLRDQRRGGATVSAGYAGNLVLYAVARGIDRAALLTQAGMTAGALGDPDNRIPLEAYKALMRAAKAMTGDAALALHLGATQDFKEISVVGLICYAAPTMGEALMELNRYARLAAEVDFPAEGGRFQIQPRAGALWLVDTRSDPQDFPEMTESTWSRFISETARHFPEAPFAKAVHVPHARPAHGDAYEQVLKVPVSFASAHNAIEIDASWLSLPLHNPNRYVFGVLSEHADRLLADLQTAKSVRALVEAYLIPVLHKGDIGMEEIARDLGFSRPTLYRRLREEGVTYDALVDDLRRRMAVSYLDGGKTSVSETAYLVGFSDPSSFSRAFKRWTGSSPRGPR